MKSTLKELSTALAQLRAVNESIETHRAYGPAWEGRENELLATADLNDDSALAEVSTLRVKQELLPRKISILESQLAQVREVVRTEIRNGFNVLHPLKRQKEEALKALIRAQLTPVLTGSGANIDFAVTEAYRSG